MTTDHDDDDDDVAAAAAGGDDKSDQPMIQLGFSVPIKSQEQLARIGVRTPDYSLWDGGQIGGRPTWLHPRNLPSKIQCQHCHQGPLRFICQIYAPLDTDDVRNAETRNNSLDPGRGFHRALYVFACPSCSLQNTGALRVLRSQLPKQNPFFPVRNDDDEEEGNIDAEYVEEVNWRMHEPGQWDQSQCGVCGLAATKRCPLQNQFFCGKDHQKEYKKYVFDPAKSNDAAGAVAQSGGMEHVIAADEIADHSVALPSVYAMTELVVEEEPEETPDIAVAANNHDVDVNNDHDDSGDDSDRELEQDDLNRATMGDRKASKLNRASKDDPTNMYFYRRISDRENVRTQCLRYCRWPSTNCKNSSSEHVGTNDKEQHEDGRAIIGAAPLWIQEKQQQDPESIPPCQYCGASRRFEFQLMPQMLHYLLQNRPASDDASGGVNQQSSTTAKKKNMSASAPPSSLSTPAYDKMKAAISQTEMMEEELPPEMVSPVLVDAKEAAIERIQKDVLGLQLNDDSGNNAQSSDNNNNNNNKEVDWGVVAVYTCTNSCGDFVQKADHVDNGNASNNNTDDGSSGLGAYREEYAWRQPPY